MNPVQRRAAAFLQLKGYSLKATWRAMRATPTDHFPLILPGVHPLASFFILWRLKGRGFSDCQVVTHGNGLAVYAHR
jgi:glycine/D-amino acid oxidase-like deaminating enzyme